MDDGAPAIAGVMDRACYVFFAAADREGREGDDAAS